MSKCFCLFSMIAIIISSYSFTLMESGTAEVQFVKHKTFHEVRRMAQVQNKPIFLDFYANWCGPCKNMEKRVFKNPEVAFYMNAHFINFKVDIDTPEGKRMAQRYGVKYLPTLMVVTPEGKVIKKKASNMGVNTFSQFMSQAKDDSYFAMAH